MSRRTIAGDVRSSMSSAGRCFVYVLPCVWEDLLKLGFSRDPLARMRSLHRRWFEFFDLDRTILVETETVSDARRLELELARPIAIHGAVEPITIRSEAAGRTEWYRGASLHLVSEVERLRARGFVVHEPARNWLRDRLVAQADGLYSWSGEILAVIDQPGVPGAASDVLIGRLCDVLDAYAAFAIDLDRWLPEGVKTWLGQRRRATPSISARDA